MHNRVVDAKALLGTVGWAPNPPGPVQQERAGKALL